MTREELLEKLYEIKNWKCNGDSELYEIIKEVISALEAQKWIPCNSLELPKDKKLWVTHDRWGCRYVDEVYWDMIEWSDNVSDVVAYMPYVEPEPYKEEVKYDER